MNPNHLISNYLVKVKELFSSIAFLESQFEEECEENEFEKKFQSSISKLKLLEIIHNKYVLGVSGFQGSGKTTLMQWFLFDNPEIVEWIPENHGVGENLPVLLTCKNDIKNVSAILYNVARAKDSNSCILEKKIKTPKECREILKNPKSSFIMVEIKLPNPNNILGSSSTFLENTSFLLMPGFEETYDEMTEDKSYRQDYMKMALAACANTLLVIDPASIPRGEQDKILKEIMEMFGETNALYILTNKDSDPPKDAYNRLLNYKIPEERIIETGTQTDIYTRDHVDNWRKELYKAICNNSHNKNGLREIQRRTIGKVVKEVNRLIREVEDIKDLGRAKLSEEDRQKINLFKNYDDSIRKIRERFFNNYDKKINLIINETILNIDAHHKDDKNWFEKIVDWFREKVGGPATIRKFKEEFENYFTKEIEKKGGQKNIKLELYNKTLGDLGVYQGLTDSQGLIDSGDYIKQQKNALGGLVGDNLSVMEAYTLDTNTIQNIQFLIGGAGKNKNVPNRAFKRAMKLIPYLVFDMQRIDCVLNNDESLESILLNKDSDGISDSFKTQFGDAQINVKSFLTGIAALAGVDYFPDGELNSIGGLMTVLFGKSTAAGTAGTASTAAGGTAGTTSIAAGGTAGTASIASIATGVAIAAILFQVINLAAIGHTLKKISTLTAFANKTRDELQGNMRYDFDLLYDRVRDFMEDRMSRYLDINDNTGALLKLEHKIKTAQIAGTEIKEHLRA